MTNYWFLMRGDAAQPCQKLVDLRSHTLQLFLMNGGEFSENGFAAGGERKPDLAAILPVGQPPEKMLGRQPVHQAHGAVMPNLQPFGQFADGDPVAAWKTLDSQHRLVALRSEARRVGRIFTEMQKLSERVAELCQRLEFGFSDFMFANSHAFYSSVKDQPIGAGRMWLNHIVIRYNVNGCRMKSVLILKV